jgi:hypothetical protein
LLARLSQDLKQLLATPGEPHRLGAARRPRAEGESLVQPELRRAPERLRRLRLRGPRADRGGRRDHHYAMRNYSVEHFPGAAFVAQIYVVVR